METIVINKTHQELFDGTVEHFALQGRPAMVGTHVQERQCRYSLKSGEEILRCAIGCHLPKDLNTIEFEGRSVEWLTIITNRLQFPNATNLFLIELQRCHDAARDLEDLKERFLYLAKVFDLSSEKVSLITKWEMPNE